MEFDNDINILDNNEYIEAEENGSKRCRLPRRQTHQSKKLCAKEERNASIKKVSLILQKPKDERSTEESEVLVECKDTVDEVKERWRKRDEAKRRLEEIEDPISVMNEKCQILAQAIAQSQHLVVYTGAGISTAAKIPDYRGPNGIWTKLQKGQEIGDHDLSLATPTFTHMALFELYKRKILKYVVSQNCDGLHLRSGLPRTALSEVHGNMYIEVCKTCKPHKEYWRLFDVTENTARYAHKTSRKCYVCNCPLIDTIVHFGERGSLQWPLNWQGACKNAKSATTIVCLGSSLKVLKKYPWLWQMDKPAKRRPNLYIVNLQWTPKDDCANVKVHGKCDDVMKIVMDLLGISVPSYDEAFDPLYAHATHLNDLEYHTTTQPILKWNNVNTELDVKEENHESVHHRESQVQSAEDDTSNTKDCSCDLNQASINNFSSHHCDKNSNRNNSATSSYKTENQCLPLPKDATSYKNNSFSIDSILQYNSVQETNISSTLPHQDTQIYLNSFNLFFNHSIFGSYSDFLLYPYQTSFLYPGLHSIINPSPFFKDDLTISHQNSDSELTQTPSCVFCNENYKSLICLFYQKTEPTFGNIQFRYSKIEEKNKCNVCVCCDYTTEEEDLDESSNDKDINPNDKDIKNKIQAGWFGKGYKKYRKYKKKSV